MLKKQKQLNWTELNRTEQKQLKLNGEWKNSKWKVTGNWGKSNCNRSITKSSSKSYRSTWKMYVTNGVCCFEVAHTQWGEWRMQRNQQQHPESYRKRCFVCLIRFLIGRTGWIWKWENMRHQNHQPKFDSLPFSCWIDLFYGLVWNSHWAWTWYSFWYSSNFRQFFISL